MSEAEKATIGIRRMSADDIDALLTLDQEITEGKSLITREDVAATKPGGSLDFSFIAEAEGRIVGFILAELDYLGILFSQTCLIHGIGVDPDYQHHGIGSLLMNQLYSYCEAEDIHTIRALAIGRDTDFINFIEKMGFTRSAIVVYDRNLES